MDNVQIDTGEKRVVINGDESRVIVFNPRDPIFAEKFYGLTDELKSKARDYEQRENELKQNNAKDENGVPVNLREIIRLHIEAADHMRGQIDYVFGAGTSQTAFGDTRNLEVFKQFFDGIAPFFTKERNEKIAKYTTPASAKRNKRK